MTAPQLTQVAVDASARGDDTSAATCYRPHRRGWVRPYGWRRPHYGYVYRRNWVKPRYWRPHYRRHIYY